MCDHCSNITVISWALSFLTFGSIVNIFYTMLCNFVTCFVQQMKDRTVVLRSRVKSFLLRWCKWLMEVAGWKQATSEPQPDIPVLFFLFFDGICERLLVSLLAFSHTTSFNHIQSHNIYVKDWLTSTHKTATEHHTEYNTNTTDRHTEDNTMCRCTPLHLQ